MIYDFTRCNNLDWIKNDQRGYATVYGGKIYFYSNTLTWNKELARETSECLCVMDCDDKENDFVKGLEIIPRNKSTYDRWKMGDALVKGSTRYVVINTLNSQFLVAENTDKHIIEIIDSKQQKASLEHTPYEEELLALNDYDVCGNILNGGDLVLGMREGGNWFPGIYARRLNDKFVISASLNKGEFSEMVLDNCVKLNSETLYLFGTDKNPQ